jgi:cytochrome c oxidase subunit 4
MSGHVVPIKTYLLIFFALMILTGATTGAAFVDMGFWNTPVALAIAAAKMTLVVLFFMHAKYTHGLTQVVILCGFFFLALLVAFTLADELTRHWGPQATSWSSMNAIVLHARSLF